MDIDRESFEGRWVAKKNGISVSLVRNKRPAKGEKASLGDQVFMSPALLAYKYPVFLLPTWRASLGNQIVPGIWPSSEFLSDSYIWSCVTEMLQRKCFVGLG